MRLLTAKQTADVLQVALPRVYELAREGVVPAVRLGRQVRFDEAALQQWIARGGAQNSEAQKGEVRNAA